MASPGSQAATRTDPGSRNKQTSGKTSGSGGGAGTAALLGAQAAGAQTQLEQFRDERFQNPGQAAKDAASGAALSRVNSDLGKQTGGGDEAPTITRTAPTQVLPSGATLTPNNTDTYDTTGRLKSQGTSPYVSDPSAGQIAGALLGAAPVAGTLNRAAGLAAGLANGDNPVSGDDGGMLGRMIDGLRGVKPGAVTGYTGNRVASSTNSRGDQGDDTRMADRAGAAATAALTGDSVGAGTSALFSDVTLADRRKPRNSGAGTDMLLKAA